MEDTKYFVNLEREASRLRDEIRQERRHNADLAKQLRIMREWMAEHGEGSARVEIRDLSERLLWSDAAEQPERGGHAPSPGAIAVTASLFERVADLEHRRREIDDMLDRIPSSVVDLPRTVAANRTNADDWFDKHEQRLADIEKILERGTQRISKRTWAKINKHIDDTAGKRKREDVKHITMIADQQNVLAGRTTAIAERVKLQSDAIAAIEGGLNEQVHTNDKAEQRLHVLERDLYDLTSEVHAYDDDHKGRLDALEKELVKLGDRVRELANMVPPEWHIDEGKYDDGRG